MCYGHYRKWQLYGDPLEDRRPQKKACTVEDCSRLADVRGVCMTHHKRVERYGDPFTLKRKYHPRFVDEAPEGHKTCRDCLVVLPLSAFNRGNGVQGVHTYCRECGSMRTKAKNARPGERLKQQLCEFNMTPADYYAMLAAQNGHCAYCPSTGANSRGGRLHMDHDHSCCPGRGSCGKCVRRLLCSSCNFMEGAAKGRPERLLAVAAGIARDQRHLVATAW